MIPHLRRLASVALTLSTLAASAPAQILQQMRVDSSGAWHSARRLRQVISDGHGSRRDSLALAAAEHALGRPELALTLARALMGAGGSADPAVLAVSAEAEFAAGNYERAARLFRIVATEQSGWEEGVLRARAAVAFERAGISEEAAVDFRRASVQLPQISGWLAVSEARVTSETVRALSLLRRAPPEAMAFASSVRAAVLVSAGDTVRALSALAAAGERAAATQLARSLGDTATARLHAFRALESGDTATVRVGLQFVLEDLPYPTGFEAYEVASAHRRLGETDAAIALLELLVTRGDSSAATLRRLGELLSARGRRQEALKVFERAAREEAGPEVPADAALAKYRAARLLLTMGRASEGYAALERFAAAHATDANAPAGLFTVADWHRRSGRRTRADSILAVIAARWPNSSYAGRARMALAASALDRRDTSAAVEWYDAEARSSTADRRGADYFSAELRFRTGDSAAAMAAWTRLAQTDSLGYFGLMARTRVELPAPGFPPPGERGRVPSAELVLGRLDLLRLCHLDREAEEVLRHQVGRADLGGEELLALAEGLIERGWVQEGVSLGWRASAERSLNDERVLRVIFPWPLRDLIEGEAAEHRLDPHLLAALIRQESNFRPAVVSRAGARGLMQLMPSTAAELARRSGIDWDQRLLQSAEVNLHLGAAHLAALLRTYDGDVLPALAAYNAGGRPVARWLRHPDAGDPLRWVESITYAETRAYVRSVIRNLFLYRGLYPEYAAATGDP